MRSTASSTLVPAYDRHEAARRAATENRRFATLVAVLGPDDWSRPTDCTEWDVRAVVAHVLGAMEGHVSLPTMARQMWLGKRAAGDRPDIDGMTEVQVRERAHLSAEELARRTAAIADKAAAARSRRPALMRSATFSQPVGGTPERWTFGYLLDVVLTRDVWMHRVDISRATGRPMELTADHDGQIVADVVHEWSRRHGLAFSLELHGPAGGEFREGDDGEQHKLDAVEFCRILSGRAAGTGLLSQSVPF